MILSCPFCGVRLGAGDRECPRCARRVGRPCPNCAEEIPVDSPVCKYCGEESGPERPPAPPPRRPDVEFLEEPVVLRCAWENPSKGFLRRWWGTWRESNFSPRRFFRAMPPSGGHRWPVGFTFGLAAQFLVVAVLAGVGIAAGTALAGKPLEPSVLGWGAAILVAAIPVSFACVTAGLYAASILWHIVLKILGAKEGFQATLRIVGYSSGTAVWGLIPFAGGVIQAALQSVLYYHGFRQVHGMSKGRALFAALLPLLAGLAFAALALAATFATGDPRAASR